MIKFNKFETIKTSASGGLFSVYFERCYLPKQINANPFCEAFQRQKIILHRLVLVLHCVLLMFRKIQAQPLYISVSARKMIKWTSKNESKKIWHVTSLLFPIQSRKDCCSFELAFNDNIKKMYSFTYPTTLCSKVGSLQVEMSKCIQKFLYFLLFSLYF